MFPLPPKTIGSSFEDLRGGETFDENDYTEVDDSFYDDIINRAESELGVDKKVDGTEIDAVFEENIEKLATELIESFLRSNFYINLRIGANYTYYFYKLVLKPEVIRRIKKILNRRHPSTFGNIKDIIEETVTKKGIRKCLSNPTLSKFNVISDSAIIERITKKLGLVLKKDEVLSITSGLFYLIVRSDRNFYKLLFSNLVYAFPNVLARIQEYGMVYYPVFFAVNVVYLYLVRPKPVMVCLNFFRERYKNSIIGTLLSKQILKALIPLSMLIFVNGFKVEQCDLYFTQTRPTPTLMLVRDSRTGKVRYARGYEITFGEDTGWMHDNVDQNKPYMLISSQEKVTISISPKYTEEEKKILGIKDETGLISLNSPRQWSEVETMGIEKMIGNEINPEICDIANSLENIPLTKKEQILYKTTKEKCDKVDNAIKSSTFGEEKTITAQPKQSSTRERKFNKKIHTLKDLEAINYVSKDEAIDVESVSLPQSKTSIQEKN